MKKISDMELLNARIWLWPAEAARVLRISKRSAYRLAERNVLKATEDRPVRFSVRSIKEYIKTQTGEEL